MTQSTNYNLSARAVLSLLLLTSLTVASPIATTSRRSLSIRAERPPSGSARYEPLAEQVRSRQKGQETAFRASRQKVKVVKGEEESLSEDSKAFSGRDRPIKAGLHTARVIWNPKNSKRPSPTPRTTVRTDKPQNLPTQAPATTSTTTTTTTTTSTSTTTTATTTPTASPSTPTSAASSPTSSPVAASIPTGLGCFPASTRTIPTGFTPTAEDLAANWWCAEESEYAFMGFSYGIACQSRAQLVTDFTQMRTQFGARYVRLYGACDSPTWNDDLVEAASAANVGLYGLIWFGFDGGNIWQTRYNAFVNTMRTNPKAPYIFRNVAIGSEPLYDGVLPPDQLANEILSMKKKLAQFGTEVTMSEMPYGLQINGGAPSVMAAVDIVEGNVLPFFDSKATTGDQAWGVVSWSLGYFQSLAPGKQVRMTQTGWPSNQNVWKANAATAVASVSSEASYYTLLDSKCSYFKANGGIGWFAHIWNDDQLPGWGITDGYGNLKFPFSAQSTC